MTEVIQGETALAQRRDRLSRTTHSLHFVWVEDVGRTASRAHWRGHRNASMVMGISFLGLPASRPQYEVTTELPGGKSYRATLGSLEDAQAAADAYFEQWVVMMGLKIKDFQDFKS